MSAIVLYEILHCLAAACLAVRLFCHAHSPAQTKRYVLAGAAACLFLGDVYWLAHLIIRGEPPAIFSACDVAYIGFLLMFNTALPGVDPQRLRQRPFAVWMAVFTLMNVVAWMVWTGAWFNNLLWGVPMLLLAAHSAMLVEKDLPRARRTVFFALVALLVFCESAVLAGGPYRMLAPLCVLLWVLSLVQLAFTLKDSLKRLSVPAWALIMVFCDCASFLTQGAVYYGFQLLMMVCFAYAAVSACKEGEARHAV